MPVLIDREAKRQSKSPLDIEKFGDRFKTLNDYFSFPDPSLTTIDKNLFYLLRNSDELPFESKYSYRPDYLSFDLYGTVILWELLLYVNGVPSVEDFVLDRVIVPSLESIIFILQDSFPERDVNDLQAIDW
jgi:hypothetical protein